MTRYSACGDDDGANAPQKFVGNDDHEDADGAGNVDDGSGDNGEYEFDGAASVSEVQEN